MMVAVGPKDALSGGAIYVVTNSGNSFASTYTFYQSTNGGMNYTLKSTQNFSNYVGSNVGGRNSVQNMRTRPYPFIAVDNSNGPHRGRLYLVYASNFPVGNGNKPDIFCRYSDDGGTNWSAAKTANDDANTAANHNWFPAVWTDKNTGRLYISWMDTRDCPTSDSAMIYATYTDDGVTFAPNQQVSNKKMKINCTSCGGGGTPAYLGDYNGIGSTGSGSVLAWTDFRDGNFGSFVSYFPDYAMRATPALDTTFPIATFYAEIPSVKLYTDTVFVTATVNAPLGQFTITYPEGNKIWQFPGQIPIQISSNAAPAGDYVVTITTNGTNGTPVHKRLTTVRVLPTVAPIADFKADNTNPCEGIPVDFSDLSTGPPSSWEWSFPGGTPATSTDKNPKGIKYAAAGTYSVTLKATNFIGTNTVTKTNYITVKPTPLAPVSSSKSVCFGLPVPPLTATGTDIKWYAADTLTGTGPSLVTGQTAIGVYNYKVTQTAANSCESSSTPVSLTINALPTVTMANLDTVCLSTTPFNLSGGTPAGGLYSGTGVTNNLLFTPSVAGAGNHVITYTYTNGNGCINTAQKPITVNPLPVVTMNPVSPVCITAAPIKLSGTPAGGKFSGPGVSADTLYPSVAGAGSKTISYTFNDLITKCPGVATQIVKINALPVVAIYDSTVCGYKKVHYDATISNPGSYLWTPGGATTPKFVVDTIGKGLGVFKYSVKVTDANGCITVDSAKVTFFNCTGIDEMADSKLIELYPNPNTGQFAIRSQSIPSGKYDLNVYDVRGKLVYSESELNIENSFNHPLNLRNLGNGVYVLQIRNTNKPGYNKRFVINR
jgi:PKD repeat protein